jgi:rare lipoprotein A
VAAGFLAAGCAETRLAVYAAKRATKEVEAMVSPAPAESPAELVEEVEELSPKSTPRYKVGDPYEVAGVWYYPRVDPDYDETGVGSWYGLPFHGRDTANGETYDMNELTAAHKTLPMPTMVRVTNLENGRSLVLRVNDRGPFVNGRIIDVSRRAAQLLGFEIKGTAKVRVQAMSADGEAIVAEKPITTDEGRAWSNRRGGSRSRSRRSLHPKGSPRHRPRPGTSPRRSIARPLPRPSCSCKPEPLPTAATRFAWPIGFRRWGRPESPRS